MRWGWIVLLGLFTGLSMAGVGGDQDWLPDRYNVVWDSPSRDCRGSMPLGNGDISLNVWAETNGDLVFYIGKSDSWGDNGRLLKVGRVRIHFDPPLWAPGIPFRQTLRLRDATVVIQAGAPPHRSEVQIWVDANHPCIELTARGSQPFSMTAQIDLWRTNRTVLPSIEVSDVNLDRSRPNHQLAPTIVEPDQILTNLTDAIGWVHHNIKSVGPALTAKQQDLDGFLGAPLVPDPLLYRTFGTLITAEHGQRLAPDRLLSPTNTTHHFTLYVLTRHPASIAEWLEAIRWVQKEVESIPFAQRRQAHAAWWKAFWQRSWIHVFEAKNDASRTTSSEASISGGKHKSKNTETDAFVVSRGYALQRFITACAGRGRYPIKFNGSLFTVAWPGKPGDADYRRWGPGYWWQNTRLPYISLCASGDFEMMNPLFRMYGVDLMPLFCYRTRRYFGHEGAYIPECIYFWGAVFTDTYGWPPAAQRKDKLQKSRWHKWEWVSGPELLWMMLDRYEYTEDESFLENILLPAARQILTFFAKHYPIGPDGKLLFHPAQSLETWWECTNPMPEIAGLYAVTERLLALPPRLTTPEDRRFWKQLRDRLPPIPTRVVNGVRMLAPAEKFASKHNIENPELYAVFPFRLFGIGRPHIEWAIAALHHRPDRGHFGWRQDEIFMAYLGLAEEARAGLVQRARRNNPDSRFPAFWGPNYDWVPDQDHGSVLMKALQAMILQSDGRRIFLLPAWPREWNVRFRLHAPYRTVIEGEVQNGRILSLRVTPPERVRDIYVGPDLKPYKQTRRTAGQPH